MISPRYHREIPQRYRLEAGQCTACNEIHFPPRHVCRKCGGEDFETMYEEAFLRLRVPTKTWHKQIQGSPTGTELRKYPVVPPSGLLSMM